MQTGAPSSGRSTAKRLIGYTWGPASAPAPTAISGACISARRPLRVRVYENAVPLAAQAWSPGLLKEDGAWLSPASVE